MTENKAIERIKYRIHTVEQVVGKSGMEDLEVAIKALEEVQQYRTIGTLEECRAAVEKQTAKKVKSISRVKDGDSYVGLIGKCPCCGDILEEDTVYCDCGQRLDWRTSDKIDYADELTDIFGFENTQEEQDENVGEIITFDDIDRIPTAYDIDKVVTQLEELRKEEQDRPDDCDEDGCGDGEQIYDDGRSQGRYEAFGKAIEIVKGGGVDG